jgi:hypothetical protein
MALIAKASSPLFYQTVAPGCIILKPAVDRFVSVRKPHEIYR